MMAALVQYDTSYYRSQSNYSTVVMSLVVDSTVATTNSVDNFYPWPVE